jgi:mRNA-degrading endonuclease toxin of MazEF toxin-antitoxin module
VSLARGAVWFADLPGIVDKPVVVVSPEYVNEPLANAIVARITSVRRSRTLPTFVPLAAEDIPGLPEESFVICHDLFTVPQSVLRRPLGELPVHRILQLDAALRVAVGLS